VTRIVFGVEHADGSGWRLLWGDDDFLEEVHEAIMRLIKSMAVDRGIKSRATPRSERFWRMCNRAGDFAVRGIFSIKPVPTRQTRVKK